MLEKSCGTIPYTIIEGVIHYLLVRAKDDGYCGFPKGHVEGGESEEETALRETMEETSVAVTIHRGFRHETSYRMPNGNDKTVVYFLASFQNQQPERNGDFEDFEYLILPYDKAYSALTYDNAKKMLQSADQYLSRSINESLLLC